MVLQKPISMHATSGDIQAPRGGIHECWKAELADCDARIYKVSAVMHELRPSVVIKVELLSTTKLSVVRLIFVPILYPMAGVANLSLTGID